MQPIGIPLLLSYQSNSGDALSRAAAGLAVENVCNLIRNRDPREVVDPKELANELQQICVVQHDGELCGLCNDNR